MNITNNRINLNTFFNNAEKENSHCKDENELCNDLETFLINKLKGLSKDDINSIVDRANIIYHELDQMDNRRLDNTIKSLKNKDFEKIK